MKVEINRLDLGLIVKALNLRAAALAGQETGRGRHNWNSELANIYRLVDDLAAALKQPRAGASN